MAGGEQAQNPASAATGLSGIDGYCFGPVAAIRPWLFQKSLGLLIATDVVVLMTERGARYGIDGFNVAHFGWLDRLQPIPQATWYVGVLMIVAVLALLQVFLPTSRVRGALLAICYTYGWAMSRHDSYLHHYLTTLMLLCSLFFPRLTVEDLVGRRSWLALYGLSPRRLGIWVGLIWASLLAYRIPSAWNTGWGPLLVFAAACLGWTSLCWRPVWRSALAPWLGSLPHDPDESVETGRRTSEAVSGAAGAFASATTAKEREESPLWKFWVQWLRQPPLQPWRSAPGFRMLGMTVGIVYIYTSIAKMDAEWCGGYTLQKVGEVTAILGPIARAFSHWGLPTEWFWSIVATAVIPLELAIAASYLIAVRQDEPQAVVARRVGLVGWCLAMALHTNNEMMGLTIQWFSYYMMFLAFFFLLPASVVWRLGALLVVPARWSAMGVERFYGSLSATGAVFRVVVVAVGAAAALQLTAWVSGLPGPAWALPVAAGGLLVTAAVQWVSGHRVAASRLSAAGVATALFLLLLFTASSVRFDYYRVAGRTQQKMIVGYGFAARPATDPQGASEEPWSPAADQSASQQQAIDLFRRALEYPAAQPGDRVEVLTNLGLAYRHLGDYQSAVQSYQEGIELGERDGTVPPQVMFLVHYNLGVCFRLLGEVEGAAFAFQRSLEWNPQNSDALVNLGQIRAEQGSWDAAITCYEAAQKLEPNAADIRELLAAARAAQQPPAAPPVPLPSGADKKSQ